MTFVHLKVEVNVNHMMLFATNSASSLDVSWWWKDVFVPIGIGVLSPLLIGFLGFLAARQTEWYRRLSRWEPYGRDLWLLQVRLYGEICEAARIFSRTAYDRAFEWRDGEPEIHDRLTQAYNEKKSTLDSLKIQSAILLYPKFNDVYNKFTHKAFMLATEHNDPQYRTQYSEEMYALFGQLLDAARSSVGTDVLGDKTKEEILNEIRKPSILNP
jgi:hypothetical protein